MSTSADPCPVDWPTVLMGGRRLKKFSQIAFEYQTTQPGGTPWTATVPVLTLWQEAHGTPPGALIWKACCFFNPSLGHPVIEGNTDASAGTHSIVATKSSGGTIEISSPSVVAGVSFYASGIPTPETAQIAWAEFETESVLFFDSGTVTVGDWSHRFTAEIS